MCSLKVKLLIVDVDGTLTYEDQSLSIEALTALRNVRKLGVKVGIASALPYCVVKYLTMYLGCDPILIAESGGVVEAYDDIRVLGDKEEPLKALRRLKEVYGESVVEKWSNRFRLTEIALERNIPYDKIVNAVKDFNVEIVDTKYAYHIIAKGVSKGVALNILMDMVNVRRDEVAVAGDSMGDYDMFKASKIRLAPANAVDEIRRIATYTSKFRGGIGFADSVEWLITHYISRT